jgi:hypothetical protein
MKRISHYFALAGASVILTAVAQAQPDVNNAPKAANPANRPVGMARQQRIKQQLDTRLRPELVRLGVTDAAQQDALLAFFLNEAEARALLAQKGRTLAQALQNGALTDNQLASALNDYQGAVEDNKTRHTAALATLKKSVDYEKSPKLTTMLTVLGFVGDGPAVAANGLGAFAFLGEKGLGTRLLNEKQPKAANGGFGELQQKPAPAAQPGVAF